MRYLHGFAHRFLTYEPSQGKVIFHTSLKVWDALLFIAIATRFIPRAAGEIVYWTFWRLSFLLSFPLFGNAAARCTLRQPYRPSCHDFSPM
jgi:hypothetical protein